MAVSTVVPATPSSTVSEACTRPPVSSNTNANEIPISAVPTTELDITRISTLCQPIFSRLRQSRHSIEWAGVFGSVSRGTQRPDSDVDIIVGHRKGADFVRDVLLTAADLTDELPMALGRPVDVVCFVQGDALRWVDMEAFLCCKTIWGEPSWPEEGRTLAATCLTDGFVRLRKAENLATQIYGTLPSSLDVLSSPENSSFRLDLLSRTISIIDLLKFKNHPFSGVVTQMMHWLFRYQHVFRESLALNEADIHCTAELWKAWSDKQERGCFGILSGVAQNSLQKAGLDVPEVAEEAVRLPSFS